MKKTPASLSAKKAADSPFDPRATSLLRKWLSVSESQSCSLEVLCAQIPEVSKLLENSMCSISERFVAMAADFERYAEEVKAGEKHTANLEEFEHNISGAISSIIVDMQFQDRVSQNLVIVTNVLNAIIVYLQDEINETTANLDERNERAELDKEFAMKLLKFLTLGELQHKFMDHLLTHHYINDYADLGYDPNAHPDRKKEDDIDLF